jgi:hypothetical protein
MRRVSKGVAKLCALGGVVMLLGAQPTLAASQGSRGDRAAHNFLRTILKRIHDLTDISFPPG